MKITAATLWMTISSTSFNQHKAGNNGGVFYISTLRKLTLSAVTAIDFTSGYPGYLGNFLYYLGPSNNFDLTISSSSSFSCHVSSYSDAA